MSAPTPIDASPVAAAYRAQRVRHWDAVAREIPRRPSWTRQYHRRLATIYRFLIPPGQRVLEVGCGTGDLLSALSPSIGVGVDFSPGMLDIARARHAPDGLTFLEADAHDLVTALPETVPFDAIVLSDLVNDAWDVQRVLEQLRPLCKPSTRLVLNLYSRLWEWPLAIARRMRIANANLQQNWLTFEDVDNLLTLAGFETIRRLREVLWPIETPLLAPLCNRFLVKLPGIKHLGLTNVIVARPRSIEAPSPLPRVSVIVPARNEAGNIAQVFARTPEMGGGTEIVFVEGNSNDDTWQVIEQEIARHPDRPSQLHKQRGRGKGDAVRVGFANATGDILMILDADLTVPPEDLPRFYRALVENTGEFINGVRLVYPMEKRAMRLLNLAGNKFFSLAFSWLLGQSLKDTLCGTKVMYKRDYDRIAAGRAYFGEFDPFGDFDLIFGAAKLNLKIVDLPIRYRERTYGETNISRWKHGWLLLKMTAFAARKLKFN